MENQVIYSPKEIFNQRATAVAEAQKTNSPIYTPDNHGATIAVDRDMERELTHTGLVHKDDFVNPPVAIDEKYTSTTFYATRNSVAPYRAMDEASKNEIFMFLSTADPDRLTEPGLQEVILTRVADIQKRDMVKAVVSHQDPTAIAQENADEVASISSFFGAMKDAVKVEGNYFAAGYTPTEVQ
jgi:hypothetical protein